MLVDSRRITNAPGCKTDFLDLQWLWQRAMPVEYASHHVRHMWKALTQMSPNPELLLLVQRYIPHRDDTFAEKLAADQTVEHQQTLS